MDSERFDALTRALALRPSRRKIIGWLLAALAGGRARHVLADERIAISGDGGESRADGAAVHTGDRGGSEGLVRSAETVGDVEAHRGSAVDAARIDGNTAIADARGGAGNIAEVIDEDEPTPSKRGRRPARSDQ